MSESIDRLTLPIAIFQEDIDAEVSLEVQQKMVMAGIHEERIAQLRELAAPYDVEVTSEADMKALQGAVSELASLRIKAKRICEQGRRPALMVQKAYISIEKYVTGQIAAIEQPLLLRKEAWQAKLEAQKQEEQARIDAERRARRQAFEDIGFVRRTGDFGQADYYELGTTRIELARIESSAEPEYQELLRSSRIVVAEQKAKEEAALEDMRLAEEALRAREAALKERELQMNKLIADKRAEELIAAGCREVDGVLYITLEDRVLFKLYRNDLHAIPHEQWPEELRAARLAADERDKPSSTYTPPPAPSPPPTPTSSPTPTPSPAPTSATDLDRWNTWVQGFIASAPEFEAEIWNKCKATLIESVTAADVILTKTALLE